MVESQGYVIDPLPGPCAPPHIFLEQGVSASKGGNMPLTKEQNQAIIAEYGNDEKDSGSANVQVALLTQRIKELTAHLKQHPKDHHTRRGLLMLVGKRRRLLVYIKDRNIDEYRELIAKLGIRDNL